MDTSFNVAIPKSKLFYFDDYLIIWKHWKSQLEDKAHYFANYQQMV